MIEAVIFDLDDTLYPERNFVESGYRAVARHVAHYYGGDFDRLVSTMLTTWRNQGRKMVFPALLKRFPDIHVSMPELIHIYRRHTPQITMYPGYRELLQELGSHYRMGVITDGIPEVQERKVMALGLVGMVNAIIYTWKYGSVRQKPHPLPFRLMMASLQTYPESSLFVGDNPEKDWKGAQAAGMKYVHIWNSDSDPESESASKDLPEPAIQSLHQLPRILRDLN